MGSQAKFLKEGRDLKADFVAAPPVSAKNADGTTTGTVQMGTTSEHTDVGEPCVPAAERETLTQPVGRILDDAQRPVYKPPRTSKLVVRWRRHQRATPQIVGSPSLDVPRRQRTR